MGSFGGMKREKKGMIDEIKMSVGLLWSRLIYGDCPSGQEKCMVKIACGCLGWKRRMGSSRKRK